MAFYTITRANGSTITVTEATANSQTNVKLIGQNYTGYGDEIATNFLQMLENFAHTLDPVSNPNVAGDAAITGQLWYDTNTNVLKVFNGTGYDAIANTDEGSTTNSTLRWDGSSWTPEAKVRVTTSGLIVANAATGTTTLTISHNGTDANFVGGAGTTDINMTTGITAVNLPELTLTTALDETYGGTGQSTFATGDVLYASGANTLSKLAAGTNGDVLTLTAGVPAWVAGSAGVTAFNDLSDVDLTGASNNDLLYRSGGNWIDSGGAATFDGTNLTATQIAGIPAANLINRASPGNISGAPTLTAGTTALTATLGDIRVQGGFGFVTSDGATSFAVRADTGTNDIQFTHANTPSWNISGLSDVTMDGVDLIIDNITGRALKLQGNSITSANQVYMAFADSTGTEFSRIGMTSASTNAFRIEGFLAGIELVGTDNNNKLVVGSGVTQYNSGNQVSTFTYQVGTSGQTTRLAIYDDTGDYSAGFNSTPTRNSGALASGGTYTVTIDDIGKFLTRTTTSNTTVSLPDVSSAEVGSTIIIHNDNSTGTMTISCPTATNLQWVDGSGAAATGNRTLAYNSVCTARRKGTNTWQIWGNGLS